MPLTTATTTKMVVQPCPNSFSIHLTGGCPVYIFINNLDMISKKKLHYGGVKPLIMNWMIKKDAKLPCSGSETWSIKCFRKEYWYYQIFTFHQN